MPRYRHQLPQLGDEVFLTDGGMETTLIFHDGIDLPHFAAFVLLDSEDGRQMLRRYHERYLRLAGARGVGFVLDSATWRANPDWGALLGYTAADLRRINHRAIAELVALREIGDSEGTPCVISGAIGPRGDAYRAGRSSAQAARDYHRAQIAAFAETEADMVCAFTLNDVAEAAGIALAAKEAGMPCAISFTVETDGRLLTGPTLQEAIEATDAMTGGAPVYYMVNCAHPTHFSGVLDPQAGWAHRIRGVRANASTRSHAELDDSETLDQGDPQDLGRRYRELRRALPGLRIYGGCCGTDHRHVAAICEACLPAVAA
jgi:homocysteine S-methyltransferase